MAKYGNKKIGSFDSKKEWRRYSDLLLFEKAGIISGLQTQVTFELLPTQLDENGKVIERKISYIADFVYVDCKTGKTIVEDAKGFRTKDYIIKRKLMLHLKGIRIKEV